MGMEKRMEIASVSIERPKHLMFPHVAVNFVSLHVGIQAVGQCLN